VPDITIDADLWDRLSLAEKVAVEEQLRESDVLGVGDHIIAGEASPAVPDLDHRAAMNPARIACEIAAAVAKTACAGLSEPLMIAACIAAAEEGRKLCVKYAESEDIVVDLRPTALLRKKKYHTPQEGGG